MEDHTTRRLRLIPDIPRYFYSDRYFPPDVINTSAELEYDRDGRARAVSAKEQRERGFSTQRALIFEESLPVTVQLFQ